jgi:hypothetical protein
LTTLLHGLVSIGVIYFCESKCTDQLHQYRLSNLYSANLHADARP